MKLQLSIDTKYHKTKLLLTIAVSGKYDGITRQINSRLGYINIILKPTYALFDFALHFEEVAIRLPIAIQRNGNIVADRNNPLTVQKGVVGFLFATAVVEVYNTTSLLASGSTQVTKL